MTSEAGKTSRPPRDEGYGKITDDGIERMRARIGVEIPQIEPYNEYATTDSIRHFARGYGDDNPLFTSETYAKKTRWRHVIAPPTFLVTTGVSEVREIPPEVRAKGAHALAGVHEFFSGDEWEWFRPIYPGDRLVKRKALRDVIIKETSQFTGGKSVIIRYRTDWLNQRGRLVAFYWESYVRAERDAAVKQKKYLEIKRPDYTEQMVKEIDEAYEQEFRRGGQTLFWEDVSPGQALPPIVKGGMKVTDLLAWVRGFGSGVHAFKLAYLHRKRHPKFYTTNEWGYPDIVERVHWDDVWAQKIGNPYAYDFGKLRGAFLAQSVTNWMGDDAWLWKMSDQYRAFNYYGDTTWVKGSVRAKSVTPEGRHVVELEVACDNQRGVVTAPGQATVILPSRANGPVRLPAPPPGVEGMRPAPEKMTDE
jgi:acyl dehydratase